MKEVLIFLGFGGVQLLFHESHRLSSHPLVYKITHKPWLLWVFSPAAVHTVQDYAVHVVIYSGKIITGH
jgi:hypothetical protein